MNLNEIKFVVYNLKRSIFLLSFLFFLSIEIFGQVKRVEPPFWWSGMKMNELQIMAYGNKISQLEPEIKG